MMEEQQYISGFNRGYLIAKHEPDLAAQLAATENEHPFFAGLMDGKGQYEKEVQEWAKGFSKGGQAKDDRDIGHER